MHSLKRPLKCNASFCGSWFEFKVNSSVASESDQNLLFEPSRRTPLVFELCSEQLPLWISTWRAEFFCIQHAIKISQNTKDFNLIHCDILTTTNTGLFSFRVGIHSFMSIKYQGSNVKRNNSCVWQFGYSVLMRPDIPLLTISDGGGNYAINVRRCLI